MIVGHEEQRKNLLQLIQELRFPQAVLLTGMAGVGKCLIAKELAAALLCEHCPEEVSAKGVPLPCGSCHACSVFAAGNQPDYYPVEGSDKKSWNTASIRELLFRLHLSSFAGRNRVVVFNDADAMSLQAANALLKSLEEPRKGLYFILVTSNRSRLPETVLSRCQTWFFDRLTDDQIEVVLKNWEGDGEHPLAEVLQETSLSRSELATLADGSLANVENILKYQDEWATVVEAIDALATRKRFASSILVKELCQDRDALRQRLPLIRIYSRQRMYAATEAAAQFQWAHLLQSTILAESLIFERNLNASYVVEQMLLDFTGAPSAPLLSNFPPALNSVLS